MKRANVTISCLLVFLSLLVTFPTKEASACMWDHDTLQMERQRFPGVLEVITGKFLRHSKAFYKWRIQDREKKLRSAPKTLKWYDDLGVAYDKIGNSKRAIEVMLKKESIKPGLYTTYANLGTFYIHNKQLKKGLVYIRKALKINPNAHFGRERYQAWLVEYLLQRQKGGKIPLPLFYEAKKQVKLDVTRPYAPAHPDLTFVGFLAQKTGTDTRLSQKEHAAALKGILGMMRFGHYRSRILLEVLAELLLLTPVEDSKRLAARAYLQASYQSKGERVMLYRKQAGDVLRLLVLNKLSYEQVRLSWVENRFKKELREAKLWHDELVANEKRWIKEANDPDKAFAKVYYKAPVVSNYEPPQWLLLLMDKVVMRILLFFGVALLGVLFLLRLLRRVREKKKA